jgi:hypothetical protein
VLLCLPSIGEQSQVVNAELPRKVPRTEEAYGIGQGIAAEVPAMQRDMRHPLVRVIILADAGAESCSGGPQRRMECAEAGATHDGDIEHGMQPAGKNAEAGGHHPERCRVRGECAQDRLQQGYLVVLGHMVRHMRKGRNVHAMETETVLQAGPQCCDPFSVPLVQERDNTVHTFPLAPQYQEASSRAPRRVRAR